jgi:hypothetical protein
MPLDGPPARGVLCDDQGRFTPSAFTNMRKLGSVQGGNTVVDASGIAGRNIRALRRSRAGGRRRGRRRQKQPVLLVASLSDRIQGEQHGQQPRASAGEGGDHRAAEVRDHSAAHLPYGALPGGAQAVTMLLLYL